MPGTNNNNNNRHLDEPLDPRTLEQLNAYLDYELSEEQRVQVRDLLRRSPAADNEMATLKATSKVLSELPPVPAPRSFALRPAMLEQPTKSPRGFTLFGWLPSPSFALSLGSLAAACLLVLVLAAQLVSGGGSQSQSDQRLASAAPPTPSGQGNNGGLAYKNPTLDNAPSGVPVPAAAAQPATTTASAAAPPAPMAIAPTPTTVEMNATTAMTQSATTNAGAAGGTSAASGTAAAPATPHSGLALSATAPTAPPNDVPNARATDRSAGNNPTAPAYTINPNSGATAPITPVFSDQANNPAPGGGNISASGGIPQQNTNQTNNYNVLSSGMNYWLVIEIALAVLVAALGLGALIAQRRSR